MVCCLIIDENVVLYYCFATWTGQCSLFSSRKRTFEFCCIHVYHGDYATLAYDTSFPSVFLQIYVLDVQVWYTVASALLGGLEGARDRLGEVIPKL